MHNIYTQVKLEQENNGEAIQHVTLTKPQVVSIDWTDVEPNRSECLEVYDYILLTDCVFSMDLVDDLVRTILYYTGPKTTIICCHEIRDEVSRSNHTLLALSPDDIVCFESDHQ